MKDSCNYLESILANIDTDDYEYQRTKQYNDLVCPGSEGDSEDDSGSGFTEEIEEFVSFHHCSGLNWALLFEDVGGDMQGDDCYVEEWGKTITDCDCNDPENYNYSEGRF